MKTNLPFFFLCIFLFLVSSCKKTGKEYENPRIYTPQPLEVTNSKALFRATFLKGTDEITTFGFEWKKTTESTYNKITVQAGKENFYFTATGLEEDTEYNLKSFIIDIYDTVWYGKEIKFFTKGTVSDIDGNIYLTMRYGKTVWMTENLRVTRFADGTPIEARSGGQFDDSDGPVYYHNKLHTLQPVPNQPNFGLLYNWAAARNAEDCNSIFKVNNPMLPNAYQGICPAGWHLPSSQEWTELIDRFGGSELAADTMKSENWPDPPAAKFNYSHFSIEPAGFYYWDIYNKVERDFRGHYESAFFWTSNQITEAFSTKSYSATGLQIVTGFSKIENHPMRKCTGYSIRCIKD